MSKKKAVKVTNPHHARLAGLRTDDPGNYSPEPPSPDPVTPKLVPKHRQLRNVLGKVEITNPKANNV